MKARSAAFIPSAKNVIGKEARSPELKEAGLPPRAAGRCSSSSTMELRLATLASMMPMSTVAPPGAASCWSRSLLGSLAFSRWDPVAPDDSGLAPSSGPETHVRPYSARNLLTSSNSALSLEFSACITSLPEGCDSSPCCSESSSKARKWHISLSFSAIEAVSCLFSCSTWLRRAAMLPNKPASFPSCLLSGFLHLSAEPVRCLLDSRLACPAPRSGESLGAVGLGGRRGTAPDGAPFTEGPREVLLDLVPL
mmetsp:Transcript_72756/g.135947  ORF Transcript_72756/g.135947 Transcript_72756/m.135947 type:complete len:252 (+) Transcript_72756:414-1169(+)